MAALCATTIATAPARAGPSSPIWSTPLPKPVRAPGSSRTLKLSATTLRGPARKVVAERVAQLVGPQPPSGDGLGELAEREVLHERDRLEVVGLAIHGTAPLPGGEAGRNTDNVRRMDRGSVKLLAALALVAAFVAAAAARYRPPPPRPGDAPPRQFSAVRARELLREVLGDGQPHPAGSAAAASVRQRIAAGSSAWASVRRSRKVSPVGP